MDFSEFLYRLLTLDMTLFELAPHTCELCTVTMQYLIGCSFMWHVYRTKFSDGFSPGIFLRGLTLLALKGHKELVPPNSTVCIIRYHQFFMLLTYMIVYVWNASFVTRRRLGGKFFDSLILGSIALLFITYSYPENAHVRLNWALAILLCINMAVKYFAWRGKLQRQLSCGLLIAMGTIALIYTLLALQLQLLFENSYIMLPGVLNFALSKFEQQPKLMSPPHDVPKKRKYVRKQSQDRKKVEQTVLSAAGECGNFEE